MPSERRARSVYAAYGQATNFKDFQGQPLPKWEDLPKEVQVSWVKVSKEVLRHENELRETPFRVYPARSYGDEAPTEDTTTAWNDERSGPK